MILNFNQFITEEHSQNDPIPEITRVDNLGIILLGAPGIGKSTFVKNFILTKRPDFKVFSTDDISLTMTKSHDVYYPRSSELNLERLAMYIETRRPFIYDTTGTDINKIRQIWDQSKNFNYTLIFIHLIGTKEQAQIGNISRPRKVDSDYLSMSHEKQFKNMEEYLRWNPYCYYMVNRIDNTYQFWKAEAGKIWKRGNWGDWSESSQSEISRFF